VLNGWKVFNPGHVHDVGLDVTSLTASQLSTMFCLMLNQIRCGIAEFRGFILHESVEKLCA